MADWKIDIVSPSGTKTSMAIEGDADDAALRDFIESTLATHREQDAEPMTGEPGTPATFQPRRDATVGKA